MFDAKRRLHYVRCTSCVFLCSIIFFFAFADLCVFFFFFIRRLCARFTSPKSHKNIHWVVKLFFFFLSFETTSTTLCGAIHALFYIAYISRVFVLFFPFSVFPFLCLLFCFRCLIGCQASALDKQTSIHT